MFILKEDQTALIFNGIRVELYIKYGMSVESICITSNMFNISNFLTL